MSPLKLLLASLSLLAVPSAHGAAAETRQALAENHDGRDYLDKLARNIEWADDIVVTEHSDRYDAAAGPRDKPIVPDLVYRGLSLDKKQREFFRSTIANLDPKTQDMFPACTFEPHHTIRFFQRGVLLSTMDICFVCGEVDWNLARMTPPRSLYGGLANFIKGIGLEPKRDWRALAKRRLAEMTPE